MNTLCTAHEREDVEIRQGMGIFRSWQGLSVGEKCCNNVTIKTWFHARIRHSSLIKGLFINFSGGGWCQNMGGSPVFNE